VGSISRNAANKQATQI